MPATAASENTTKFNNYKRIALWQASIIGFVGTLVVLGVTFIISSQGSSKNSHFEIRDTRQIAPSGLPLPRFVSLKADEVYLRKGPSKAHSVLKIFTKEDLPLEVIREYDVWRQVRYLDGTEGWIHSVMLTGRRNAQVTPPTGQKYVSISQQPVNGAIEVAKVEAGVIVYMKNCDGEWCAVESSGYNGWMPQATLWGVYGFEHFK